MKTLFRLRFKQAGAHIYIRFFAGKGAASLGKCGDLVMRSEEWDDFLTELDRRPPGGSIEILGDHVTWSSIDIEAKSPKDAANDVELYISGQAIAHYISENGELRIKRIEDACLWCAQPWGSHTDEQQATCRESLKSSIAAMLKQRLIVSDGE